MALPETLRPDLRCEYDRVRRLLLSVLVAGGFSWVVAAAFASWRLAGERTASIAYNQGVAFDGARREYFFDGVSSLTNSRARKRLLGRIAPVCWKFRRKARKNSAQSPQKPIADIPFRGVSQGAALWLMAGRSIFPS